MGFYKANVLKDKAIFNNHDLIPLFPSSLCLSLPALFLSALSLLSRSVCIFSQQAKKGKVSMVSLQGEARKKVHSGLQRAFLLPRSTWGTHYIYLVKQTAKGVDRSGKYGRFGDSNSSKHVSMYGMHFRTSM